MPKLIHRNPKICHHASGQAFIKLNGRTFYLGAWRKPSDPNEKPPPHVQEAYNRLVGEWLANGRCLVKPAPAAADGLTINELCVAYLHHAKGYYRKKGRTTAEYDCIRSAIRPLRELYGHTPAAEFGPVALKAVREKMIDCKHPITGRKWCRTYINKAVDRLRRIFRWGVENEYVPGSLLHALQAVQGLRAGRTNARETQRQRPVPQEHIDAVKKIVRQRTRDIIDLLLLTAARPGELLALTGAMIDRSGSVWVGRIEEHKTAHHSKERLIYFGPQAQLLLTRYWKIDPNRRLFFSMKSIRSSIRSASALSAKTLVCR